MSQEIASASLDNADVLECAEALRQRVLHAVGAAIAKLADEARGTRHIEHDGEMRACIALARLAPAMLRMSAEHSVEVRELKLPPDLPEEEAMRLLDELDRLGQPSQR